MKPKSSTLIPLAVAGAVLLLACTIHWLSRNVPSNRQVGLGALVEQVEWLTYDARVKLGAHLSKPEDVATNMATVFIDDEAFKHVNNATFSYTYEPVTNAFQAVQLRYKWPWPLFLHGQIVRELAAEGAVAAGFDILFPEEDEDSPRRRIPDENAPEGYITSDEFFARQVKGAGNVVLATEGNVLPLEMFRTNAFALGNIFSSSDYGVLRRVKPFGTVRIWHPIIKGMEKSLGLQLDQADLSQPSSVIFPVAPNAMDLNPDPVTIFLKPDGTMKLTTDGGLAAHDETAENLAQKTEAPFTMQRVWNLGIVLAAKALRLDMDSAEVGSREIVLRGPGGLVRTIPLDKEGFFYIDWSITMDELKRQQTPIYFGHLPEVLLKDFVRRGGEEEGEQIENPFAGRVVVIGSIATGNNLADVGSTPLEEKTPLVTKHLNVANSVLTGRFIERAGVGFELALIALLSALASYQTWKRKVLVASASILILSIGYIAFATWLYVDNRTWLAMFSPVAGGLLLPHFALVTYRVLFEQREQRRVRGIFSRIVSPDVVQELLSAEKLSLGGARQLITVFFADVRGFTEFTDAAQAAAEDSVRKNGLIGKEAEEVFNKQAAETLNTVNLYLATIADLVKKHGGTLDKYIGDCVMAFWGAPVPNQRHAICCVRAAIDAQRAIYSLNVERFAENERRKKENEERAAAGKPTLPLSPILSLGSGINTGYAIVGLMGSNATILNYTVFGREVNLASRLEGVSQRGRIIISEATFQDIKRDDPELAARVVELPATTVKGFRQAVKIYEVPWKDGVATPAPASATPTTTLRPVPARPVPPASAPPSTSSPGSKPEDPAIAAPRTTPAA